MENSCGEKSTLRDSLMTRSEFGLVEDLIEIDIRPHRHMRLDLHADSQCLEGSRHQSKFKGGSPLLRLTGYALMALAWCRDAITNP